MYNRKKRVLYVEIQLELDWKGFSVGECWMYMAFGYYASLFPWQNKKVKTKCVTFYLTIRTSILELQVYILQFRLYQSCEIL